MKGLLNGTVKLVMLQFAFSNVKIIPLGLFKKPKEALPELVARKSEIKGVQFLGPVENVSILGFHSDLRAASFLMVDAFFRMRTNPRGQEYPTARFTFVPEEDVQEGEFAKHRERAIKAFTQMGEEALWNASGFLNQLFKDGNMVEGQHSISINLKGRNPLVNSKGEKLLQWPKDETGRIGDKPVPIEPKLFLRIIEDDIRVV